MYMAGAGEVVTCWEGWRLGHSDISEKGPESGPLLDSEERSQLGGLGSAEHLPLCENREDGTELLLLSDSHLQKPFLTAALLLVLPWAVPGVEGQTILQTLRPQEAGGAGPAPRGRGYLQNLLGVSGWERFPGHGEAAVPGG